MAPATNKFCEGEKVLCFHGPLIYEAKILKWRKNPKTNEMEYFVHYQGWSKKWDEYVPEVRVLKDNEANSTLRQELQKTQASEKKKKPRNRSSVIGKEVTPDDNADSNDPDSTPSRSSTPVLEPKSRNKSEGKKVKSEHHPYSVETESQLTKKVEVKVEIPDELKRWIVEDNKMIVKKKKLFILPAKIPVSEILLKWVLSKKTQATKNIYSEIAKGIVEHFEDRLYTKLLYSDEREQFEKIAAENPSKPLAEIYGSAHLLRLFVKMGHILEFTSVTGDTLDLTLKALHDFLKFWATDAAVYFSLDNYS